METPEERLARLGDQVNTDHDPIPNNPEPPSPMEPIIPTAPESITPEVPEAIEKQIEIQMSKEATPATPATPAAAPATPTIKKDNTLLIVGIIALLAMAAAFIFMNLRKKKEDAENTVDLDNNQYQDLPQ